MGDIYLGASDWRHSEWRDVFYPADMPEEWWLTYYNTQYSCVWLPISAWQAQTAEAARQWLNDIHGRFRFVLEAPSLSHGSEAADINTIRSILETQVGKVCDDNDPGIFWFGQDVDLREFTSRLQSWQLAHGDDDNAALYLVSRDGDLATLDKVKTLLELLGL